MIYLIGIQVLSFTFVLIFLVPFLAIIFLFFVNLYSYTFYAMAYRQGNDRQQEKSVVELSH